MKTTARDCPHGQLARQCPLCERDAVITRMRAALLDIAVHTSDHPMFLGKGSTEEDMESEGGDAAFITMLYHTAKGAL